MIYYFSGTGNSLYIARHIAQYTNDRLCNMVENNANAKELNDNEPIGFIFPVYAWGLPKVVENFLMKLAPITKPHYTYAIFTCGDDIGMADHVLRHVMRKRKWKIDDIFSIIMRETYICLPGFELDTEEVKSMKHKAATTKAEAIANYINIKAKTKGEMSASEAVFDTKCKELNRGSMPWFKSYIIRPLFNKLLISDKHFHTNKNACSHCGKCQRTCPLNNISLNQGMPQWNGHCTHCLRCYHICPNHAIEYGFFTKGKGQVKINL